MVHITGTALSFSEMIGGLRPPGLWSN